jgi:hypothetical protein
MISAVIISLAIPAPLPAESKGLNPPCSRSFSLSMLSELPGGGDGGGAEEKKHKPPVTGTDVAIQFAAGTVGGVLSVIGAGIVIFPNLPSGEGMENIGIAMLGAVMAASAFPIGNSLGVYLAGSDEEVTGSYLLTLTGSLLGSLAAAGVMVELEMRPESYWAPVILPSAGAITGFNLTRRYRERDEKSNSTAYIRYRQRAPGSLPGLNQYRGSGTHYVEVVNLRFQL